MKLIKNIEDLKKVYTIKDLLEKDEIKVDFFNLISNFLNIEINTYKLVHSSYIIDKNFGLACNLKGKELDLYDNYIEDKGLFLNFLKEKLDDDILYYIKFETIDCDVRAIAKTYRLEERIK